MESKKINLDVERKRVNVFNDKGQLLYEADFVQWASDYTDDEHGHFVQFTVALIVKDSGRCGFVYPPFMQFKNN